MDNSTQEFINNANKPKEKPLDYVVRPGDELKVTLETLEDVCIIIAAACLLGFITYVSIGG